MKKFLTGILLLAAMLLAGSTPALSQALGWTPHARNGERALEITQVEKMVRRLCDTTLAGRRIGTPGGRAAGEYLAREMQEARLQPLLSGGYFQPFTAGELSGRNIVGCFPAQSDRWIVIGAHYDHLGRLDGRIYPGADKNASGVGALFGLVKMIGKMVSLGKIYGKGVIFVAFDGKETNLAGSTAFVEALKAGRFRHPVTGAVIEPKHIAMMLNLDLLGGTENPGASGRKDYLIALTGSNSGYQSYLRTINEAEGIGLELKFDYFGSADFTRLFYERVSDQKPFLGCRIPSVMFTSGITMRTNKPTDTPDSLDFEVLRRRILLIYYFLAAKL